MDSSDSYAKIVCIVGLYLAKKKKKIVKRKSPRWWVRPIYTPGQRRRQGHHDNLIREMRLTDPKKYTNWMRMTVPTFDKLIFLVGPLITKTSFVREPIDPTLKLELTLRYLATGESMSSLGDQFRVGYATVSKLIRETLQAIIDDLEKIVMPMPKKEDWLRSANGFYNVWNFPNCVGAIDGKHIAIRAPPSSGSDFFNYKLFFSIILLAICDYRHRFIVVDIGAQGRQSDGGVFRNSEMGQRFEAKQMNLPEPDEIYDNGPILPYFLVGDEAFGLKDYIQKPYPGRSKGNLEISKRILNYRLSRARLTIENTFGIFSNKWRIFLKPIEAKLETIDLIVKAATCLHNYILIEEETLKPSQKTYLTPNLIDREVDGVIVPGNWRKDTVLKSIGEQDNNNDSLKQTETRDVLKEYFMNEGSVEWQWDEDRI